MIGYTTIGTNDFESATSFYDALFDVIGAKRAMETDHYVAWSNNPEGPMFAVGKPFNGEPASIGNGVMIALPAQDQAQVHALHKKALELGGSCEGEAGPRGAGFYAAYFRDRDGNKLNAFCMVAE